VIVTEPMPAPLTCGCVVGVVAPCGMITLTGVTMTFEPSSLVFKLTVTPPNGAGADSVTANDADWPSFTGVFAGKLIAPVMVTAAVALAMFDALAVIFTAPGATAATDKVTLVAPGAKLTVAGTVALLVSLEFKFTVRPPAGACPPPKVRVSFPDPPIATTKGESVKAIVGAVTVTVSVLDV